MKTEDRIIHEGLMSRIRELEDYSRHQAFVIKQACNFSASEDQNRLHGCETKSEALVEFLLDAASCDEAMDLNFDRELLRKIGGSYFSSMAVNSIHLNQELERLFPERKHSKLIAAADLY